MVPISGGRRKLDCSPLWPTATCRRLNWLAFAVTALVLSAAEGGAESFIALDAARLPGTDVGQDGVPQPAEGFPGKQAVGDGAALSVGRPEIRSRPGEDVSLAGADPGRRIVQTEPAFGVGRQLDGVCRVPGPRARDRGHAHAGRLIILLDGEDDHAGAVLDPFLAALIRLVAPEIGVADDQAGAWGR